MIDHRIATHKKKMDQIEEKRKVLREKDWKDFIRSDDPQQQLFALDHYRDYVSSCGGKVSFDSFIACRIVLTNNRKSSNDWKLSTVG